MNVTKETITPKKAMEWLKRNVHNRPLRETHANRIAGAMSRGEWKLNGETIKFNGNGDLIDGQHRLSACIASGKAFDSYVVRGLAHEAFDTIDGCKPRGASDVFARMGEKYYRHLSTAIRWASFLPNGCIPSGGNETLTNAQHVAYLEKNSGIRDSVERASQSGIQTLMSIGQAAALHFLMSQKDAQLAELFWHQVSSGESIRKGMPAYELRKKLIDHRSGKSRRGRSELVALAIKAWNAARKNLDCKALKWADNEAFPVIE